MFISKDCVSESFKCGFPNVSYSRRDALQSMFLTDVKFHWSMARQRRGRSLVLGEEYVCFIFFPSELFPVYFLFFSHIHSICFSTVVKNIIHPFDECLLVDLVVVYNCLKMLSQMMAFFFLFFLIGIIMNVLKFVGQVMHLLSLFVHVYLCILRYSVDCALVHIGLVLELWFYSTAPLFLYSLGLNKYLVVQYLVC